MDKLTDEQVNIMLYPNDHIKQEWKGFKDLYIFRDEEGYLVVAHEEDATGVMATATQRGLTYEAKYCGVSERAALHIGGQCIPPKITDELLTNIEHYLVLPEHAQLGCSKEKTNRH